MVLEADDEVIGIAHNDNIASVTTCRRPAPPKGSEVEGASTRRVMSRSELACYGGIANFE